METSDRIAALLPSLGFDPALQRGVEGMRRGMEQGLLRANPDFDEGRMEAYRTAFEEQTPRLDQRVRRENLEILEKLLTPPEIELLEAVAKRQDGDLAWQAFSKLTFAFGRAMTAMHRSDAMDVHRRSAELAFEASDAKAL